MYRYKYITLLDTDEVIMPKGDNIYWKDLMERVIEKSLKTVSPKKKSRASYNVRNVYFFDQPGTASPHHEGVPSYMHMFQHVQRARNYTKPGAYIKCFHDPERVLTLHNHFPLACLGGSCGSFAIGTEDAQLQHYRADCVRTLRKSCGEYKNATVRDDTIWRHRDPVVPRVETTLRNLGFFRAPGG